MPRVEVGSRLGVDVLLWQTLRTGRVRMRGETSSYFAREGRGDRHKCYVDKKMDGRSCPRIRRFDGPE